MLNKAPVGGVPGWGDRGSAKHNWAGLYWEGEGWHSRVVLLTVGHRDHGAYFDGLVESLRALNVDVDVLLA
jgi:hypothetical protein